MVLVDRSQIIGPLVDITQIVRPEGFKYKIEKVQPGVYVVTNAYEGEYSFWGDLKKQDYFSEIVNDFPRQKV